MTYKSWPVCSSADLPNFDGLPNFDANDEDNQPDHPSHPRAADGCTDLRIGVP